VFEGYSRALNGVTTKRYVAIVAEKMPAGEKHEALQSCCDTLMLFSAGIEPPR
jgi:hypothetical protein